MILSMKANEKKIIYLFYFMKESCNDMNQSV